MTRKAVGDASAARHAERRRAAVILLWLCVALYSAFALVMGLAPALLAIPAAGLLPLGMPLAFALMLIFPSLMAWYVRRHGQD